jgi:hypothetical protein
MLNKLSMFLKNIDKNSEEYVLIDHLERLEDKFFIVDSWLVDNIYNFYVDSPYKFRHTNEIILREYKKYVYKYHRDMFNELYENNDIYDILENTALLDKCGIKRPILLMIDRSFEQTVKGENYLAHFYLNPLGDRMLSPLYTPAAYYKIAKVDMRNEHKKFVMYERNAG